LVIFFNSWLVLSGDAPCVRLEEYLPTILNLEEPVCFFVGAMAHGEDNFADMFADEKLSVSEYSLSASVACSKITNGNFQSLIF
jgi:rRNA small subunit pseudouridine methyltransferase Nep1